jgi:hypothetical protein
MTAIGGQASVEYAGLLGLAAVLGAALALVAGPPVLGALRNALVAALSGTAHRPTAVVASAADIADVQSALLPTGKALTPDATLLALAQRHGMARAREVADALLLVEARSAVPWIGTGRTYRAWERPEDGPYEPTAPTVSGDRDVETVTGTPVVTWITLAERQRALAAALAHHTSASAVALDLVGVVPFGKLLVPSGVAGVRALVKVVLEDVPDGVELLHRGSKFVELAHSAEDEVPPEMRAGDVVIAWPVERTFWRDGRSERTPAIAYEHRVVLRPGTRGLRLIAEEVGA